MTNWSTHDRAAFNDWLNTDLGQKFFAHFKEQRPKLDSDTDNLDINKMAMKGALYAGYEKAIEQIDKMRMIIGQRNVEPRPYVRDAHKDNPQDG